MKARLFNATLTIAFVLGGSVAAENVHAQTRDSASTVEVTPLGSHQGEFCRNDRALLFEDPTGVRVLYDPGRTVAGGSDDRLKNVDVVLVTSAHGDHIGDAKGSPADPGTCARPNTVPATPHSNSAEIAAEKNSAVIVGGEMADFMAAKIGQVTGTETAGCPASGLANELVVPRSSPCTGVLRHGGKRTVTRQPGGEGVRIAVVTAVHSNGVPRSLLSNPEAAELEADGLTAYVGPELGYVLTFSNGLSVYLSGDTGLTSDMSTVVRDFYEADLAVVNIGDIFSLGPEEAAFAVENLVKPKAVIPSHANEEATTGGSVNPGTRTERFVDLVDGADVHLPLSGVTMAFDQDARCTAGCG